MTTQTDVVVAPPKKRNKTWQTITALAVMGMTNVAMAEDHISGLGDAAKENMSAGLTVVVGIFAVGIGIWGVFKGYEYLKSGTKRA